MHPLLGPRFPALPRAAGREASRPQKFEEVSFRRAKEVQKMRSYQYCPNSPSSPFWVAVWSGLCTRCARRVRPRPRHRTAPRAIRPSLISADRRPPADKKSARRRARVEVRSLFAGAVAIARFLVDERLADHPEPLVRRPGVLLGSFGLTHEMDRRALLRSSRGFFCSPAYIIFGEPVDLGA